MNTESLKALHAAVETLSTGKHVDPVDINFYQRDQDESGDFLHISLRLTDSLVPLYEAFGVITPEDAEELRSQEGSESRSVDDVNFLQWLESTIQVWQAVRTRVPQWHILYVIACGKILPYNR